MSAVEIDVDPAVAVGRAAREAQGLPVHVEDPTVLAQAAGLLARAAERDDP